jgi:lysophospholipase L1-like esterase
MRPLLAVVVATALALGLLAVSGGSTGAAPTANPCGSPQRPGTPAAAGPQTVPPERPRGWGAHWLPALDAARAGRSLARVAIVGDSVGEGLYASDLTRTSWAALVRGALQAGAGDGGSGFEGMQRSQTFIEGFPAGASEHYLGTAGNTWVQTGGWRTPLWPHGPAYGALVGTEPGSAVTIPFAGTELALWYADRDTAWTYSVDGGPERRVRPNGSGAPTRLRLPGLPPGTHSVRVTATQPDGPWLVGVEGSGPSGVRVDNFSIAGLESGAWNNADRWRSGELVGGRRAPADLVVYELGGNDALKAVRPVSATTVAGDPAVTGAGWQAIDVGRFVTGPGIGPGTTISAVDAETGTATLSRPPSATGPVELLVTNTDVVVAWQRNLEGYLAGLERHPDGTPVPDIVFVWAPAGATPAVEERYEQLKTTSRAIAESLGAAFVDVQAATQRPWSSWCGAGRAGNEDDPATPGADGGHPSDAGHRVIADLVLSIVS